MRALGLAALIVLGGLGVSWLAGAADESETARVVVGVASVAVLFGILVFLLIANVVSDERE